MPEDARHSEDGPRDNPQMHSLRHPNAPWRRTVIPGVELDAIPPEEEEVSPGGRLAVAAFCFFVASQVFRWGWWTDVMGHTYDVGFVSQSVNGFGGAVAAAGLAVAIRAKSGASSGFRFIQLLPFVLGLVALLLSLGGLQQTYTEMASHQVEGRAAGLDVGVWMALIGAVLALVAGWKATRARLSHPLHQDAALAFRVLAPEIVVAAVGVPIWLVLWFLAGHTGGAPVGAVGLVLSPIAALAVWHWFRRDAKSAGERREDAGVVPVERLRERGRNR